MLYSEIGKLKRELNGLKKVRDQPALIRLPWIASGNAVTVVQQCVLAGVSRATVYARRHPKPMDEIDRLLTGAPHPPRADGG